MLQSSLLVFKFPGGATASLSQVGGKGFSLMKGCDSGLPVPPGFVLPVEFFHSWLEMLRSTPQWKNFVQATESQLQVACNDLKQASTQLKFDKEQLEIVQQSLKEYAEDSLFAVRSSSPEEDLDGASFAGGYETILGVDKSSIEAAVRKAFSSCLDYRVALYKREHAFDTATPKIAVVVQKQIASDVAGVGFSINPLTNNFDEAVFNANFGLGETVVAGLATPDTFKVNKVSKRVTLRECGAKETSIWLKPDGGTTERPAENRQDLTLTDAQILELEALICKVEQLYGRPIDTEWAFQGNNLYLLQARPITAYVPLAPNMVTEPESKRKNLYIDVTIVVQGLYKPISSMGTWAIRTLVGQLGTQLLGTNLLHEPGKSVIVVQHGRIFLNASNIMSIFGKDKVAGAVANMDPISSKALSEIDPDTYVTPSDHFPHPPFHLLTQLPEIAAHLIEARLLPEHAHKNAQGEIARFMSDIRDLVHSSSPIWEIGEKVIARTFKVCLKTTIPLFVASRLALTRLKSIVEPDHEQELAKLERALPNNVTTEMGLALYHLSQAEQDSRAFNEEWRQFMELYGHRGPQEFDIASRRYRDDPDMLLEQIGTLRQSATADDNPQLRFERAQVERNKAFEQLSEQVLEKSGWVQLKRFQSLYRVYETLAGYREVHKYLLIFALDQLRTVALDYGKQLVTQGKLDKPTQVFDLTMQDLAAGSNNGTYDYRAVAASNRAFPDKLAAAPSLPSLIDSRGLIVRPTPAEPREGEVIGTPISSGTIRGRVKVLHGPDEKPLYRGEILVARATDPGWTPLFVNASAVILEIGGMLQHGALVAREYGLPCVAGIQNATTLWTDGTLVEVDGSAGVIRVIAE